MGNRNNDNGVCRQCHGVGYYPVANGPDDVDLERCNCGAKIGYFVDVVATYYIEVGDGEDAEKLALEGKGKIVKKVAHNLHLKDF